MRTIIVGAAHSFFLDNFAFRDILFRLVASDVVALNEAFRAAGTVGQAGVFHRDLLSNLMRDPFDLTAGGTVIFSTLNEPSNETNAGL